VVCTTPAQAMTVSVPHEHGALPRVAVTIMESLYQHRLLTTEQLRVLHTPDATAGWMRRVLRSLSARGLVDRVRGTATRSLWYLTELGADTIEAAGTLAEPRRRVTTSAQAAGPLRAHTIAVNDAGIAFVRAARKRGDECGSGSWRHEIAHPISRSRGRRPAELVVADALLTYLQIGEAGGLTLHQRFIELDRGTARPAEQLASKITRYARLRHYAAPGDLERPLWRSYYRAFPQLLIVLADQSRERIQSRIQRTLALHESDPTIGGTADASEHRAGAVSVSFVALDDLINHGPFAPAFLFAERPQQPVDWLGRRPEDRGEARP
jgi:DNA-binding MarR family transcriptional regulator